MLCSEYKIDSCQKHGEFKNNKLFGRWLGCLACAQEQVIELDKKRDAEELEKRRAKFIALAHIPNMFEEAGFKTYQQESNAQTMTFIAVKDYLSRLKTDLKTVGNLIMTGRTGNGKTHLACAVIRTMAHSMHRVRYVTSAKFVNECFATWDDKSKSIDLIVEHYTSYDVLLIDEVGLNDCTNEKAQSYFNLLIDARYLAKKPTIITSNLFEAELAKLLGDRSFSRVCENGLLLRFDWADYRQRSRRGAA